MKLQHGHLIAFDRFMPIYNWYYPIYNTVYDTQLSNPWDIYSHVNIEGINSRALYIHIPFCETICSFCPFSRTTFASYSNVKRYVEALIKEITLKCKHKTITNIPISAIYFGGGTPSVLEPDEIILIGRVIRDNFDLSQLSEFSFEFEVKSVSKDRIDALKQIGVTHARFGLQTFSEKYRKLFNLTSSLEQIYDASSTLVENFDYVSFDMLYGMHGQTDEEFVADIIQATKMGTNNIDFYPINNLVTQDILRKNYDRDGLKASNGLRKLHLNVLLREYLAKLNFFPHNGHGYVRDGSGNNVKKECITTDKYIFNYHKHVYGYSDTDLLGFGNGSISSFSNITVTNCDDREKYIDSINSDRIFYQVGEHEHGAFYNKPITMHLPYFGYLDKNLVNWNNVNPFIIDSLEELKKYRLVYENENDFYLTFIGWLWYVNLFYYLSSPCERLGLDMLIKRFQDEISYNPSEEYEIKIPR